jgi:hypothetical protein
MARPPRSEPYPSPYLRAEEARAMAIQGKKDRIERESSESIERALDGIRSSALNGGTETTFDYSEESVCERVQNALQDLGYVAVMKPMRPSRENRFYLHVKWL